MNMNERIQILRIPPRTTPEDLESRYLDFDDEIIRYGDLMLVASYYWQGPGQNSWIGAVYEFLEDGREDVDDEIVLRGIAPEFFKDEGHAIAWGIRYAENRKETDHE